MLNNPIKLTDPTGHKCVGEQEECLNEKGKPINGVGGLTPTRKEDKKKDNNSVDPEQLLQQQITACQQNPIACLPFGEPSTSDQGYSNQDFDALYDYWENAVEPLNDLISMDDIYRMSGKGGWRAARYSLNLGIIEAVVQGSRQAYRDTWYQSLTPTQRTLRPVVVGAQAWATDMASGAVGMGYAVAGGAVGGPVGAAGGKLAGSTLATITLDKFWMQTINPMIFNDLGAWP